MNIIFSCAKSSCLVCTGVSTAEKTIGEFQSHETRENQGKGGDREDDSLSASPILLFLRLLRKREPKKVSVDRRKETKIASGLWSTFFLSLSLFYLALSTRLFFSAGNGPNLLIGVISAGDKLSPLLLFSTEFFLCHAEGEEAKYTARVSTCS